MSLLTLIQSSCDLLGISRPSVVVSSSDQQVRELLALAQEEGEELAGRFDWQRLTRQFSFTTTATPDQAAAIPDDWDRWLPNTQFDRTTRRALIGPITAQAWQAMQAEPQLNSVWLAYRVRDGQYLLSPSPTAGDTIAGEYVSRNWVQAQDGSYKPAFTADDDQVLLDERVMRRGLRWRFRKTKGLDYAQDFDTYEGMVERAMARDQGSARIGVAARPWTLPGLEGAGVNLPRGDFPGPA